MFGGCSILRDENNGSLRPMIAHQRQSEQIHSFNKQIQDNTAAKRILFAVAHQEQVKNEQDPSQASAVLRTLIGEDRAGALLAMAGLVTEPDRVAAIAGGNAGNALAMCARLEDALLATSRSVWLERAGLPREPGLQHHGVEVPGKGLKKRNRLDLAVHGHARGVDNYGLGLKRTMKVKGGNWQAGFLGAIQYESGRGESKTELNLNLGEGKEHTSVEVKLDGDAVREFDLSDINDSVLKAVLKYTAYPTAMRELRSNPKAKNSCRGVEGGLEIQLMIGNNSQIPGALSIKRAGAKLVLLNDMESPGSLLVNIRREQEGQPLPFDHDRLVRERLKLLWTAVAGNEIFFRAAASLPNFSDLREDIIRDSLDTLHVKLARAAARLETSNDYWLTRVPLDSVRRYLSRSREILPAFTGKPTFGYGNPVWTGVHIRFGSGKTSLDHTAQPRFGGSCPPTARADWHGENPFLGVGIDPTGQERLLLQPKFAQFARQFFVEKRHLEGMDKFFLAADTDQAASLQLFIESPKG